jgi:hypothetical protein
MALTVKQITEAGSDEALFEAITAELRLRSAPLQGGIEELVGWIRTLPRGLRAMAATYQLDVSMALDDLGWHFANWHSKSYAEETQQGLYELGAREAGDVFRDAYRLVLPYWDTMLADGFDAFVKWYRRSPLYTALDPLNVQMWALCKCHPTYGLMGHWLTYAVHHPEKLIERPQEVH